MKLNERSVKALHGVHLDLVRVVDRAAYNGPLEFVVTEGVRELERQKLLVQSGASRTMKSRHLTGHAVDLAVVIDGQIRWDWPLYAKLWHQVLAASLAEQVPVEWGGNWKTFKDGCHFQLPYAVYPEPHA